jgi:probable rRNA maturation factor
VVVLERQDGGSAKRVLLLFAARAYRAVGLRGEVSIRVTTDADVQDLNYRFRRKNAPTDVLSFSSNNAEVAGDIAISGEFAARSAVRLGHSCETELKILILHGLLHLAGYDHENDHGEMAEKESALRRQFKLPVGLIERAQPSRNARISRTSMSASRNTKGRCR